MARLAGPDVVDEAALMAIERCCPAGHCEYTPAAVGFLRRLRSWCRQTGQHPAEAAYTFLHAGSDRGAIIAGHASGVVIETPQQRWADRLIELERAEAAGMTTDQQISQYLCPFAVLAEPCYTGPQAQPCPEVQPSRATAVRVQGGGDGG